MKTRKERLVEGFIRAVINFKWNVLVPVKDSVMCPFEFLAFKLVEKKFNVLQNDVAIKHRINNNLINRFNDSVARVESEVEEKNDDLKELILDDVEGQIGSLGDDIEEAKNDANYALETANDVDYRLDNFDIDDYVNWDDKVYEITGDVEQVVQNQLKGMVKEILVELAKEEAKKSG